MPTLFIKQLIFGQLDLIRQSVTNKLNSQQRNGKNQIRYSFHL